MMKNSAAKIFCLLIVLCFAATAFAQRELGVRPTDSGGVLMPEQAAFDVKAYDIAVRFDPARQTISGATTVTAQIKNAMDWFVLDLDTPFEISEISFWQNKKSPVKADFERRGGKIWIKYLQTVKRNETVNVRVVYAGKPRVAPRPPWVGGLMWEKTADGSPWITIACQNDGADLWFPVKDHPSDEADMVSARYTVPENLYVAANGKLEKIDQNPDATRTFHWKMSNPINSYNIIPNIAPYKLIEDKYTSVAGETFPVIFYALPESAEKARDIVEQTKKFLAFYEKYLGPYPFRAEKLGIAETPHLGMEHSTVIAYGNKFKNNEHGFDGLMLHELGHEWWGNLVTNADWKDFWIHEGFQSFMDTLYLEEIKGKDAYLKAMAERMKRTRNMQPVAPREPKIAYQVYMAEPDYVKSDGDIYGKGAVVLHTLRYLIGDEAFFRALRKMAYPTKKLEKLTDGRQTRFVTTDDFLRIAEDESKMRLEWFFEVYLRQPKLPKLISETKDNQIVLRWETPNNLPFPMPVEIEIGGKKQRIEMKNGAATVNFEGQNKPALDPQNWILKSN
jgi:aminopeptidase N